jgi:hypothetical protein
MANSGSTGKSLIEESAVHGAPNISAKQSQLAKLLQPINLKIPRALSCNSGGNIIGVRQENRGGQLEDKTGEEEIKLEIYLNYF